MLLLTPALTPALDALTQAASLLTDPVFADLVFTVVVAVALVLGAVVALAMLPWTDREIAAVDTSFKRTVGALAARVSPQQRVPAPRRAA